MSLPVVPVIVLLYVLLYVLLVVLAVALWFVMGTGMPLTLGSPTHALLNLPFALALGIPLLALLRRGPA